MTRLIGDAGPGPHRTFAADPSDAGRGWFVDANGVFRQLANGTVAPVAGVLADVRSLSVHVAAAGATDDAGRGAATASLHALVAGGRPRGRTCPPGRAARFATCSCVDAVTLLVSTDEGIFRTARRRRGLDARAHRCGGWRAGGRRRHDLLAARRTAGIDRGWSDLQRRSDGRRRAVHSIAANATWPATLPAGRA